jgi:hypothetical protein
MTKTLEERNKMKAKQIQPSDIADILISSLPSRPTAPVSLGGKGYGASQMKEAFDKLPLYIIERYNELINDISELGEDSLCAAIPTGIRDGHTLCDLFKDVKNGGLAGYLIFLGKSLNEHILALYEEIDALKKILTVTKKEEVDK